MKYKICFVSGAISRSGGTERVGSIIANALSKQEYEVHLLSFWNHGNPYYPLDQDVKLHYLLDPKKEGKLYRTGIYPIIKLHSFIKKYDIDVLIDIDTVLSRHSAYAIQGTKCKLVSWEHFNYWAMQRLGEKQRFRAKKLIKKYASGMVVLTDEDRIMHQQAYQLPDGFVTTIRNPCLSDTKAQYDFEQHVFLSVGRLAPQKGYDLLLKAWKAVQGKLPEWKLVIVGSGSQEEELLNLRDQLSLKRVEFVGHSDQVDTYYKKASCYVLSSRYEGFPMVILEAQSYGLPTISFDCKTGPKELIIPGENGYLAEEENIDQLAEYMVKFAQDSKRAKKMSDYAMRHVQQYTLESITEQWVELLKKIVSE